MQKISISQLKNGTILTETGLSSEQIDQFVRLLKDAEELDLANLKIQANMAYKDSIDYLKSVMGDNISVIDNKIYIRFEDSNVEAVLLGKGLGDGVGIQESQLQSIKDIGTWFSQNSNIISFNELKETSITELKYRAFFKCSALKSIRLSNNVTVIKEQAFNGCSSLTDINLEHIEDIQGAYTFSENPISGELYMPNYKTYIPSYVFQKAQFTKITSLGQCTKIDSCAFRYSGTLTEAILPETCKVLGQDAFDSCSVLSKVNLNSIEQIGPACFRSTALNGELYIPNLKGSLGMYSFYRTKLTKITSLGQCTSIGRNSFTDIKTLTEVVLPETCTKMEIETFANCSALSKINLEHIEYMDSSVFSSTALDIELNMPNYKGAINSYCFNNTKLTKIISLGQCTNIGDVAFENVKTLTEVTLPETCTNIKTRAFNGCSTLSKINLEHVEQIGISAFSGTALNMELNMPYLTSSLESYCFNATKLTKVISLGQCPSLGSYIFQDVKTLTEVTLPETCNSIGFNCFNRCTSLVKFICQNDTPPTLTYNPFESCPFTDGIYVPDSSVDTYKTDEGWSRWADKIKPISECTE